MLDIITSTIQHTGLILSFTMMERATKGILETNHPYTTEPIVSFKGVPSSAPHTFKRTRKAAVPKQSTQERI